jgi:hypothetical protein
MIAPLLVAVGGRAVADERAIPPAAPARDRTIPKYARYI